MADTAENQRAKIIDITELLRKGQEESKSEIVTTRHAIQTMDNSISNSLTTIGNSINLGFKSLADKIKVSLSEPPSSGDLSSAQSHLFGIEGWTEHIHLAIKDLITPVSKIAELLGARLPTREEREEASRDKGDGGQPSAVPDSPDPKKPGFLGRLMKGIGAIGKGLAKPLGGLFKFLGSIASIFKTLGGFLLKPIKWLVGGLAGTLGTAISFISKMFLGLAGFAALIGAIGIASATMSDKEFEEFKLSIAGGVAGAIKKIVDGAMLIWNEFAPDSWKIKKEDRDKFSNATFTAVHDTIIAVIDFAKELADSFGAGFKEKLAPFKESWESLSKTFGEIVDAFKEKDVGEKAKGGLVGIAKQVGGAVASIATFFMQLADALGQSVLGKEVKVDNEFINTAARWIKGIINFIADIAGGVKAGFEGKFDTISKSWTEFKAAIGRVADKFTKMLEGDKDKKSSFVAAAEWLGDKVGSFVSGLLDLATGIANLVSDPDKFLGRMHGKIMALFDDLGSLIADWWENGIANPRTWRNMLIGLLGPKAGAAAAATFGLGKEGIQEKEEEKRKKLVTETSRIPAQIKEFEDELANNTKKYTGAQRRFMASEIERLKSEKERNIEKIKSIEMLHKMDNAQEELAKKREQILLDKGINIEKLQKDAAAAEKAFQSFKSGMGRSLTGERINTNIEGQRFEGIEKDDGETGGVRLHRLKVKDLLEQQGFTDATLKDKSLGEMLVILRSSFKDKSEKVAAEDIQSILSGEGGSYASTSDKEAKMHIRQLDQIITEQMRLEEEQKLILLEAQKPLQEAMAQLGKDEVQEILKLLEATKGEGQKGGRIPETGLYKLHGGEIVFDPLASSQIDNFVASYLPQSGQQLNQLQMGRVGLDGAGGGTTQPVIVQDNTQAVQQHQHIHIPAPDGQTLPGERGNFVHKVS